MKTQNTVKKLAMSLIITLAAVGANASHEPPRYERGLGPVQDPTTVLINQANYLTTNLIPFLEENSNRNEAYMFTDPIRFAASDLFIMLSAHSILSKEVRNAVYGVIKSIEDARCGYIYPRLFEVPALRESGIYLRTVQEQLAQMAGVRLPKVKCPSRFRPASISSVAQPPIVSGVTLSSAGDDDADVEATKVEVEAKPAKVETQKTAKVTSKASSKK